METMDEDTVETRGGRAGTGQDIFLLIIHSSDTGLPDETSDHSPEQA